MSTYRHNTTDHSGDYVLVFGIAAFLTCTVSAYAAGWLLNGLLLLPSVAESIIYAIVWTNYHVFDIPPAEMLKTSLRDLLILAYLFVTPFFAFIFLYVIRAVANRYKIFG